MSTGPSAPTAAVQRRPRVRRRRLGWPGEPPSGRRAASCPSTATRRPRSRRPSPTCSDRRGPTERSSSGSTPTPGSSQRHLALPLERYWQLADFGDGQRRVHPGRHRARLARRHRGARGVRSHPAGRRPHHVDDDHRPRRPVDRGPDRRPDRAARRREARPARRSRAAWPVPPVWPASTTTSSATPPTSRCCSRSSCAASPSSATTGRPRTSWPAASSATGPPPSSWWGPTAPPRSAPGRAARRRHPQPAVPRTPSAPWAGTSARTGLRIVLGAEVPDLVRDNVGDGRRPLPRAARA